MAAGESEGFGIRVLVDGAWGFASSNRLEAAEIDRVAAQAVRIAKASATALRHRVQLDDRPAAHGTYETPVVEDPFKVSLETKIDELLLAADRPPRRSRESRSPSRPTPRMRSHTIFAASDGSYTDQTITHVGSGVETNAIEGDEHQRRSYPDAGGGWQSAGYEYIRGLHLADHVEALSEEAVALLTAPQCPSGRMTIVLDPSQLYLQVHESCGHPDRARPGLRDRGVLRRHELPDDRQARRGFRYGSDLIDIVADATAPGGLGTFGWDDEGVAAQAVPLVKEGIFVGYLSSRETAPRIGRQSGGAMRADGWNRIPLIRMTNINLLPKPGMSLDEIVADTDDGLYLRSNRSWSIDDRRLNFQFATEVAYEIKGGKLGRLFKNPTYTGHHLRVLALVRRGRRRAQLRDARDAQLRQGRARPDRPRRPCGARGPLPQRPGGRGQMVSEPTDGGRTGSPWPSRSSTWPAKAGASQAEVIIQADDAALTRFANSEIHQNVAEANARLSLRFIDGQRIGVAATGRFDAAALEPVAETAGRIARHVEPNPDFITLPSPGPEPIPELAAAYSPATAEATPELRAEGARAVIAAADAAGVTAYGSFATTTETIVVANSLGVRASGAPDDVAADHRLDGPVGRLRLRRDGRGRRDDASTPGRSAGRPPSAAKATANAGLDRARRLPGRPRGLRGRRRPRHARLPRASRRWRSRRAARSSRWASGSAASSSRSATTAPTRPGCRWPSTTRASPSSGSSC